MKAFRIVAAAAVLLLCALPASAHFGMVIPETNLVSQPGALKISLLFWHPMEGTGMNLVKPAQTGVFVQGKRTDLTQQLKETKLKGYSTWTAAYAIQQPGDYIFYMEPQPYWEPGEDKFIIHYTKTVVDALGAEEGWDALVGAPMEIKPLTRPFGLYGGNSFSGQVLFKGKPLPHAEVEVEFYNQDGKKKAPASAHITQVVIADERGVFTFTMPWPGWWGFAALHEDPERKLKFKGQDKPVELGGVIWVFAH